MRTPNPSEKPKATPCAWDGSRSAREADSLWSRRTLVLLPLIAPLVAGEQFRSWPQELNRFIFSLNQFVGTANRNVMPGKVDAQLACEFKDLEPRWKRFQKSFRKWVHGG